MACTCCSALGFAGLITAQRSRQSPSAAWSCSLVSPLLLCAPLLAALHRSLYESSGKTLPMGEITAGQLPSLVAGRHFPLCMTVMYERLTNEHHLKHWGLQQFTLFLKTIGLPLEQAMLFFRHQFSPRWVGCGCCLGRSAHTKSHRLGQLSGSTMNDKVGCASVPRCACGLSTSTTAPVQPLRHCCVSNGVRCWPGQQFGGDCMALVTSTPGMNEVSSSSPHRPASPQ